MDTYSYLLARNLAIVGWALVVVLALFIAFE